MTGDDDAMKIDTQVRDLELLAVGEEARKC